MGLLKKGKLLSWADTSKQKDFVHERGLVHFVKCYHKNKNRHGDLPLWGDEMEYMIVDFDHQSRRVRVSLLAECILNQLLAADVASPSLCEALWHPEYAKYMIEGTPLNPFCATPCHGDIYPGIENSMKKRRLSIQRLLSSTQGVLSLAVFPMMGIGDFLTPFNNTNNPGDRPVSKSNFLPDDIISGHPRFAALTRNIMDRRQSKVKIVLPVFQDVATQWPFADPMDALAPEGMISMDAMGFGMGCCCLQTTCQTSTMDEARRLYDSMAVIAPIALTLTASSPIFRGVLVDRDCRWDVISSAVDDRHPSEDVPKSRYSSVSLYVGRLEEKADEYENLKDDQGVPVPPINEHAFQYLTKEGVDEGLAKHISHLFIRDPLLFYEKEANGDSIDDDEMYFENIQSTNWNTVRLKPPSSGAGWRVEFRAMEAQFTDFESAAFCVFIQLLGRALLTNSSAILVPISYLDSNMTTSQKRNAINAEKFFFKDDSKNIILMTIDEIVNGCEPLFIGLIPMIRKYLDGQPLISPSTRSSIERYLSFVSGRASGVIATPATWIRRQIRDNPSYKLDSIVPQSVAYDLLMEIDRYSRANLPVC